VRNRCPEGIRFDLKACYLPVAASHRDKAPVDDDHQPPPWQTAPHVLYHHLTSFWVRY
jgi:hypothetical protein